MKLTITLDQKSSQSLENYFIKSDLRKPIDTSLEFVLSYDLENGGFQPILAFRVRNWGQKNLKKPIFKPSKKLSKKLWKNTLLEK